MPKSYKLQKKIITDCEQIKVGIGGYVFLGAAWYFTKDNGRDDIGALLLFIILWSIVVGYRILCVMFRKRKLRRILNSERKHGS